MKFPINFTENGDKTSQAIEKIIKEFGAVYEAIAEKEPGTGGNGGLTEVGFKDIKGEVADNTVLANALSAKQPTSTKNKPGGYVGLDASGKIDAAFLPSAETPEETKKKTLRQMDLAIAGSFAEKVSNMRLEETGDFAYWMVESGVLRSVSVRCAASDSGVTPAKVQLVVNGSAVGAELSVTASSHTIASTTDDSIKINNKDRLEIAVTNTGTNKDSKNLRLIIVVEVEV